MEYGQVWKLINRCLPCTVFLARLEVEKKRRCVVCHVPLFECELMDISSGEPGRIDWCLMCRVAGPPPQPKQ